MAQEHKSRRARLAEKRPRRATVAGDLLHHVPEFARPTLTQVEHALAARRFAVAPRKPGRR